jgi:hypothetical protein
MAFKHNTSDTADGILTQGEYESTSGHILDSQAAGDMIVADTTTTMTRLAVGSADEVLTSDGSTPTYSKITTSNINASTLVIESEGIGSNDNDTTIPTSAAVKDYVDTNVTAQDLDFTGDSGGPSAVDLDSQTLTISGTANEIETSVSGQTLTVGIVTNPTIGGNLTVTGDLTVNGTTTTVDTTNTVIQDPLIELNTGAASNANDLGIVMERGSTGDNAIIAWDESADGFIVGTTTATGASTGDLTITAAPLTASTLTSDVITVDTINETTAAAGVTIDSVLLKDGGITGDLPITSGSVILSTGHGLFFDANDSVGFMADTTTDQLVLNTGTALGNQLVIGAFLGGSRDYDHANQSNPTLFIHSGSDPNTANDEWVSFAHDGTNAQIATGSGYLGMSNDLHVLNGNGLVVGHTGQIVAGGASFEAQIIGTSEIDSTLMIYGASTTAATSPGIRLVRSAGATVGAFDAVVDNEELGTIDWYGTDGTDADTRAARITVEVDGTPGTGDVPAAMVFATQAPAGAVTEALRIDSSQIVTVNGDNAAGILRIKNDGINISADEAVGHLDFESADASTNAAGIVGRISVFGEQEFGANDTPSYMTFSTNSDGAAAGNLVEALRIDSSQQVTIRRELNLGVAGSYNGIISSPESLFFNIDDDNDSTSQSFTWAHNAGGTGGTALMTLTDEGLLGIGDTANANMTTGLTINQGGSDDEILAFKSSDVAHGMTGLTETDTYGYLQKQSATGGGLLISGYSDSDAATTDGAVHIHATTDNVDTTDTSASGGSIIIDGMKKSGTSRTLLGATENIIAIRAGSTARMLLKGNGDMHITNTTLVALDDEDDIALVRAYQKESSSGIGIAMSKWDEGLKANRADLIRTGVWSSEGDFTVQQRMNDLLGGAIWQMNTKHMSLAEEVKSLKAEIKALTEGK